MFTEGYTGPLAGIRPSSARVIQTDPAPKGGGSFNGQSVFIDKAISLPCIPTRQSASEQQSTVPAKIEKCKPAVSKKAASAAVAATRSPSTPNLTKLNPEVTEVNASNSVDALEKLYGLQLKKILVTTKYARISEYVDPAGNIFAVKVPKAATLNDPEVKRYWTLEKGEAWAVKLKHPNIIKTHAIIAREAKKTTYHIIEDPSLIPARDRNQYLVKAVIMESLPGTTLLDALNKTKQLPYSPESAIHVGYHLASALAYMHENDIIYRDMKPENSMLTAGSPDSVKVLDFGYCKPLHKFERANSFNGTYMYMSPEMNTYYPGALSEYDKGSDNWSLGVQLMELCTAKFPCFCTEQGYSIDLCDEAAVINANQRFAALTEAQKSEHLDKFARIPSEFNALKEIILKLLTTDPNERMTAAEARDALGKLKAVQE